MFNFLAADVMMAAEDYSTITAEVVQPLSVLYVFVMFLTRELVACWFVILFFRVASLRRHVPLRQTSGYLERPSAFPMFRHNLSDQ